MKKYKCGERRKGKANEANYFKKGESNICWSSFCSINYVCRFDIFQNKKLEKIHFTSGNTQ